MAVKRFRPATKLAWANLALLLALAALVGSQADELRWAWTQIPDYLRGIIASPLERKLYVEAQTLLYQGKDPDAAIALLDRSIAIDPNSDAVFYLAASYEAKGRLEEAAAAYERVLGFDYLHIQARRDLVRVYRQLGLPDQARRTARDGLRVFSEMAGSYRPRVDRSVDRRYNRKAARVYRRYVQAAKMFAALSTISG